MEHKINISGKEIIEMGFKPGKWFPKAIEYINTNNLSENRQQLRKPSVLNNNTGNINKRNSRKN